MLTPKQRRFVAEYLTDLNATQAAIRAGYSAKAANREGSRLLSKVDIQAAVAQAQAQQLDSTGLTATRVLEELRRVGLNDPRGFWRAGRLVPLEDLTAEQAACIGGFEAIIKNAQAGDGHTDTVHKIKFWDKPRSLELLCKHFGLLTERLELQGGLDVRWQE